MIEPHDAYFYDRLSWAATAGTTYLLKSYSGYGAYQLTVFPCTQDAYEEDDTASAAKTISVGQTQTRNYCEDNYDWARFDAVAGTAYKITSTNGSNVYLELYDTDQTTYLTYGQSAQGGKQKVINWTAPSTGTYYIQLRAIWGFAESQSQDTGYTLSLE